MSLPRVQRGGLEIESGASGGTLDHPGEPRGREWEPRSLTNTNGDLALEPAQGPELVIAEHKRRDTSNPLIQFSGPMSAESPSFPATTGSRRVPLAAGCGCALRAPRSGPRGCPLRAAALRRKPGPRRRDSGGRVLGL
jgi:hypothetical protein